MVRAYVQEHVYKHPWERVTSASWRKFTDPENKRILSHILEVDTLNWKLDRESGKLYTTRAVTVHAPGPWFIRKIIGQDICHCVESTVVDAQTQSMQLTSRNISLQKFIEVEEKIRYNLTLIILKKAMMEDDINEDEEMDFGYVGRQG
ncbi:hypothetical protein GH714_039709 [Hevea brasiliensis]|uniref:PRELI/MSF1 domain-containing protein n=1 Tax=Hevea brasiliensis TaxID=3981 RepID=A0A6A6MX76_HEVBR|nr:hypothetical protein GH714_039709 [Hevea brasiliensis]